MLALELFHASIRDDRGTDLVGSQSLNLEQRPALNIRVFPCFRNGADLFVCFSRRPQSAKHIACGALYFMFRRMDLQCLALRRISDVKLTCAFAQLHGYVCLELFR